MAATLEIVLFEVGGQRYALPSMDVKEIVRAVAISRLPRAPEIIEGVFSLRGQVVPVLDIRSRFGLAPKPLHPSDRFIIAAAGRRTVALRVDEAIGLRSLDPALIARPETVSSRLEQVAGVASTPEGLLLIHDLRTFLSHAEKADLDQALKRQAASDARNVE